jgi:transcriptional regulator with XRE-family HTH domain
MHRLLAEKNWTAQDAAKACAVSIGTIHNLLTGAVARPQGKTVHAIARGFGMTPDSVLRHLQTTAEQRYAPVLQLLDLLPVRDRQALNTVASRLYRQATEPQRARRKKAR